MLTEEDIKKMAEEFAKSDKARETDITIFGNKDTIVQIVTLLAYIRNAINENKKCDINVSVGKNINAGKIDFIVNNDRVDDLIMKETIEIN